MTVPQAHPPGDEAEVDFGEATIVIAGVAVKVDIFHLRLSHSARAVHVAFASEGQEALLEGHVAAFARLGGVPGRIRLSAGGSKTQVRSRGESVILMDEPAQEVPPVDT